MKTSSRILVLSAVAIASLALSVRGQAVDPSALVDPRQHEERTSFQTSAHWDPGLQIPADVVMCYGVGNDLPERIAQWKSRGYIPQLMTGVSWGQYQDYLYGRFDGQNHVDEAQTDRNGKVISHGGDVYYMCPGPNYGKYLAQNVIKAIDAGAEAIHLEEPEFWARAGYGEGFKRAWRAHYKEEWIPPHASPDAQYRASKLKYVLYRDALKQIFDAVKEHNAKTGKNVKCYVPTHSLVNYAQWRIVSPESSLLQVGADGFIAQVWTGTARTHNVYRGVEAERTFQTAFLEYGSMTAATRGSGGKLWFLHDPIEDNPEYTWDNYKINWECTVVASLFWPETSRYEVAPWPDRVFHGKYPRPERGRRLRDLLKTQPAPQPIPASYATELLTVMNALNDMEQSDLAWESGTRGVGLVMSDTMMFQREGPNQSDQHLGSFFGLALPMVERGMPVEPVQLENLKTTKDLDRYKVLLMTYEGMKPMSPDADKVLADWVKAGGALVFVDDDRDPYNAVKAWWNAPGGPGFTTPRQSLFEALGVGRDAKPGAHKVDKGTLIWDAASPAALTYKTDGAVQIRKLIEQACQAAGVSYGETDHMVLRRGPYVIAAGLEADRPGQSHTLKGQFVDLFDAGLKVVDTVPLAPTTRALLIDLDRAAKAPRVLAAACRVTSETPTPEGGLKFVARGPKDTTAAIRVALAKRPAKVTIDGQPADAESQTWDDASHTLLLRFANGADGRQVAID
ncbi:MAG: hypothetical protein P4L85_10535 [Paludisphaera borealis]|uniref:hypothetical protein n=1 Tax=Paludisphaera borealis TaxID=1387353 RepID=UPI002843835E|nr:hypothetical protein [Paludisphaera borealis]MDR3619774.1 hypothetical protein [Paludisphaera borealis]